MSYFDFYVNPNAFSNDKNSIVLSQKDADVLNSILLLFGRNKMIIAREDNGDLYAYSDRYSQDGVKLDSSLLPTIPRNKYVDVKEVLRKREMARGR